MIPLILLTLGAVPAPAKPTEDILPPHAIARLGSDRFCSPDSVRELAVSYDGMRIAAASYKEHFTIWDAATGRIVCRCGPTPCVAATAFSPDGRTIAAATWDGRADEKGPIVLFDTSTGRESVRLAGHVGGSEWVAYAGDGILVTAGKDHLFRVWDLRTNAEVRQFPRPGPYYSKPEAVSPDGRLLACVDNDVGKSHPLHVYEIATGCELVKVALEDLGWEIAFAPDSRSLALRWSEVRWYDLPSGREKARWHLPDDRHGSVLVCSNDGPYLVSGIDTKLTVYDVAAGKTVDRLPGLPVSVAGRSPSTSTLFAADNGQRIEAWDLRTGRPRHPLNPGHTQPITTVAFGRDGGVFTADNLSARWWDAAGHETRTWRMPEWTQSGAISPDGRTVVVNCDTRVDTAIHLLNAATGAETGKITRRVNSGDLIFGPDGKTLVETSDRLEAWEFPSRQLLWQRGRADGSRSVAVFAPDGQTLFSGDQHGHIRERTMRTGKVTRTFDGHPDFVDANLAGWDPLPAGHTAQVRSMAVSPDGRRLVSGAWDRTLRVWEVSTGKECALLERAAGELSAEFTFPIVFSPDGSYIAAPGQSGDRRHLIDLWDIRAGKRLATFEGHRGSVTALAFAPDGRRLISGGADAVGYIWDMPPLIRESAAKLDTSRTASLWADLADADAARAFRAIGVWLTTPDAVVVAFRRLRSPDKPVDAERVNILIADLDSDRYAVRDKASKDLQALGPAARTHLRQALEKKPSVETTRRIEAILAACPDEDLRGRRAVEVLEAVGTPAARTLLEEWAEGNQAAPTTVDAAAALARLRGR